MQVATHTDKLGAKGTERLMDKGLLYTFAVAVLIIVLGFVSSFTQQQANVPQPSITQHSEGKQSPNSVGAGVAVGKIDQGSKGDASPNSVGATSVKVGR